MGVAGYGHLIVEFLIIGHEVDQGQSLVSFGFLLLGIDLGGHVSLNNFGISGRCGLSPFENLAVKMQPHGSVRILDLHPVRARPLLRKQI